MAKLSEWKQRSANLQQHGQDVRLLLPGQVDFDFSTDSWSQLNQPYMQQRMDELQLRAQCSPLITQQVYASHFPFKHFIATPLGRDAEHLLFSAAAAMQKRPGAAAQSVKQVPVKASMSEHAGKIKYAGMSEYNATVVVQNLLFHTARNHQQVNGFLPLELPISNALAEDAFPYKANLDLDKLEYVLQRRKVSLIFIEALSNATGGHPISMENLSAISGLAKIYGVALYLDATRAVENCMLIREYESAYAEHDVAAILHEFYSYCDGITLSAVKDYGVSVGGLLATRNDAIYQHAHQRATQERLLLSDALAGVLAQAIHDDDYVYREVQKRILNVRKIGLALSAAYLPLRIPVGGHCLILDYGTSADAPENPKLINTLLAFLYQIIGLRVARHWHGSAPEYQRPNWLRLAVPLACPYVDEFIATINASDCFNH